MLYMQLLFFILSKYFEIEVLIIYFGFEKKMF